MEIYCHKLVRRVNHLGMKPKESIGAGLAKSAIQASKTDSRSSPQSAPQNAPQKRRFGLLKDSAVDLQTRQVSYTYSEEIYPWILFLDFIPERDTLDTFLTHFGQFESVNSAKGDFCKQSSLRFEHVSKFNRIMMFKIPSGKQCQINRVDGLESSLYLTKVDALQIYPFKVCYLVMLVPPHFDFRAILTADTEVEAIAAWKFSTPNNSGTNKKTTERPPTGTTQHPASYEGQTY